MPPPTIVDRRPSALREPPLEIRAIAELLRALRRQWAIAGGWALDLALGRVTRPHADVDVAVFRDDQADLRAALPNWRFLVASNGALIPWEAPRATDEADFLAARALLDDEARAWLRAALRRAAPEHPWAAALADA